MYLPMKVGTFMHTGVIVSMKSLSVEAHGYCRIAVLTLLGVVSVGGGRNNPVQTDG